MLSIGVPSYRLLSKCEIGVLIEDCRFVLVSTYCLHILFGLAVSTLYYHLWMIESVFWVGNAALSLFIGNSLLSDKSGCKQLFVPYISCLFLYIRSSGSCLKPNLVVRILKCEADHRPTMSLLMLKTKNLSWQDHTLNIEVMLAPLRSTLLLNKHKTLDTKFDQEKSLYERQKDACLKDFVVEKRLIERRRQKLLRRKKELMDARAKSAMEAKEAEEKEGRDNALQATNQNRSNSAPIDSRGRGRGKPGETSSAPMLPRLQLRYTPLFGGDFLRPKVFLETGALEKESPGRDHTAKSRRRSPSPSTTSKSTRGESSRRQATSRATSREERRGTPVPATPKLTPRKEVSLVGAKPPVPPPAAAKPKSPPRRASNVKFMEFLDVADDYDDDDDGQSSADGAAANIVVEVKEKTVEEKVRDFIRELEAFNSRPPTACSSGIGNDSFGDSFITTFRSRMSTERSGPLVANRYNTLTMDKKLLENAFNKYLEKRTHDDLLKAMKLAAKMKAHIRQARNTSLVPTMAAFKSSRSFMRLLKRQQRKEKPGAPDHGD